jgi:hypothetical protein
MRRGRTLSLCPWFALLVAACGATDASVDSSDALTGYYTPCDPSLSCAAVGPGFGCYVINGNPACVPDYCRGSGPFVHDCSASQPSLGLVCADSTPTSADPDHRFRCFKPADAPVAPAVRHCTADSHSASCPDGAVDCAASGDGHEVACGTKSTTCVASGDGHTIACGYRANRCVASGDGHTVMCGYNAGDCLSSGDGHLIACGFNANRCGQSGDGHSVTCGRNAPSCATSGDGHSRACPEDVTDARKWWTDQGGDPSMILPDTTPTAGYYATCDASLSCAFMGLGYGCHVVHGTPSCVPEYCHGGGPFVHDCSTAQPNIGMTCADSTPDSADPDHVYKCYAPGDAPIAPPARHCDADSHAASCPAGAIDCAASGDGHVVACGSRSTTCIASGDGHSVACGPNATECVASGDGHLVACGARAASCIASGDGHKVLCPFLGSSCGASGDGHLVMCGYNATGCAGSGDGHKVVCGFNATSCASSGDGHVESCGSRAPGCETSGDGAARACPGDVTDVAAWWTDQGGDPADMRPLP